MRNPVKQELKEQILLNNAMGERLAELRRTGGMSQEELAERLDVSRQAVSKWERGESQPDIGNLIAISELYGVSIDYLAKGDMEMSAGGHDEEPPSHYKEEGFGVGADESLRCLHDETESREDFQAVNTKADLCQESPDKGAETFSPPPPPSGIPVVPQGMSVEEGLPKRKNPWMTFPYPLLVIVVYLFLGFAFGLWHPAWVLFLTIPFYYWVAQIIVHDSEYEKTHPGYDERYQ